MMRVIPVNIRFYWGDNYKSRKVTSGDQMVTIRYFYDNQNLKLIYRLYDNRIIMSITPVRHSVLCCYSVVTVK